MAGIENRPYAGTWRLNNRAVVKYTPDALVFINGDTSIPGCPRCRGRVDIQHFVTSLNVETGTQPGSHSANINLTLPRVQGQQVFVDGYNILRPGLEVHIFMRGYFPVRGMFSHLASPDISFPNPTANDRLDLSKYASYPYYPVFHGVVTQVTYEYSDGFYHGSLQCASLLHFWRFQNVATSAAQLGERPTNDPARTTLVGNVFNSMHPFAIIYTLYRDVAGAAAGVEFALDQESNLTSVAESTGPAGRQIYDMAVLYWEQRFKTRIQNLRMFGVNGRLFNATQQAWLAKHDVSDIQGLLTSSTFSDPSAQRREKDPFSARWSVAKSLGLANLGSDLVYSPVIRQDGELVDLSVLDMFAFSQAISEVGAVNEWQSTYQTKMDLATAVCDVTGYEFYQDVDGDLVFKPPFYNLDTSTNRYYRLQDEDIINISVVEKEPEATYAIVKGVWIGGFTGLAEGAELLKRGMYVDYKLVAQFGWRPAASLDVTYQTDPKVLFWMAVSRLDLANVDTYSASATIPIRPELRPGYPVYIPFIDCYYYISQISHQFAFGGQCTTNLVLTCRRAKFHAPGVLEAPAEGKSAIWQIKLNRPDLPPRPLEVFQSVMPGNTDKPIFVPRIVGFPNVVMAIDPQQLNPNYTVVGVGLDYFNAVEGDADVLWGLLKRDFDNVRAFEPLNEEGAVTTDPRDITKFRLTYSQNPQQSFVFDIEDLKRSFRELGEALGPLRGTEAEIDKVERQAAIASGFANAADLARRLGLQETSKTRAVAAGASQRDPLRDQLGVLEGELESERQKFNSILGENGSIQKLALVFEALQPNRNDPIKRKVDGIHGGEVTLAYFETLSHLKGQYLCGSVNGQYRYYSCSHPDPDMQGAPIIVFDDGDRAKARTRSTVRRAASALSNVLTGNIVGIGADLFTQLRELVPTLPGIDGWLDMPAEFDKLLGQTKTRGEAASRNMDATHAQRLLDITAAVNEVVNRILARSDYQEAVASSNGLIFANPQLFSGFRPEFEPSDSEAYHSAGVAIDVLFANQTFATAKDNGISPGPYDVAVNAIREEVARGFNEGLISGMGFYSIRPKGGKGPPSTFMHMDRRDDATAAEIQQRNQDKREQYLNGQLNPPKNPKERKKFFKRLGLDPDTGAVDEPKAPFPDTRSFWAEPSAEANNWVTRFGARTKRGKKGEREDIPLIPSPGRITLSDSPPPTTVASNANSPEQPAQEAPELENPPSVTTRPAFTPTDRLVVQFKSEVTRPNQNLRYPEAEIGVGKCRVGLNIAQGPQRTPRVLTTDQIHTISFMRHEGSKFTEVVGTSQTAGSITFNGQGVSKQITQMFLDAAQDLDDPSKTVQEVFGPVYEQIGLDVGTVDLPIYDNGDLVGLTLVELPPLEDIIAPLSPDQVPASAVQVISQQLGDAPDLIEIPDLRISDVAMLPGYKPFGAQKDDGRAWTRAVEALAANFAVGIARVIEQKFDEVVAAALDPATGKDMRLSEIRGDFNEILSKTFGLDDAIAAVVSFFTEDKAVKEGKKDLPLHSPVFPVSDEKGYQHYGAFRYGRGLSVEPGGTFAYIHSGQDPFRNVTAQTAEEFLREFTLATEGRTSPGANLLSGVRNAVSDFLAKFLGERETPLSQNLGQEGGEATIDASRVVDRAVADDRERADLEESAENLALTVSALGTTPTGRDVLREMLAANGDDPNLVDQESFDISDTQFVRNFIGFAANYGKSPVFQTTISNAAYKLADLTAHLAARAGDSCVCRGSLADVVLAAYGREHFVAVEDIDQGGQKAEAFHSEEIIKRTSQHALQQRRYRGEVLDGASPDAKAFNNNNAGPAATPPEGS